MKCSHVASSFYNTPWFLTREKMTEIDAFLRQRLDGVRVEASAERLESWRAEREQVQARARRAPASIAVIPVYGVIVQRADAFDEISGATSVQKLAQTFRAALAAPEVKAILFDVDSPGGSVFGIEEFSAEIFRAREKKKIMAVSNSQMASAAYYIASAADEVVASPSSDTGSIGVISLHLDFSKQAEMEGVKPSWITYGQFKAEGNELEPLGDEARGFWQGRVNEYGEMFVKAVARNRTLPSKEVRENFGQGRAFGAREAKRRGMVDSIASFDQTLELLQKGTTPKLQAYAVAKELRRERLAVERLS